MMDTKYISIGRCNGKSGLGIEQAFRRDLKLPGHPEVRVTVDSLNAMVHMSLDFYGYNNYATFVDFYGLDNKDHTNKLPRIKRVIFNEPATIVLWGDNTKTIVKCQEGDIYDPEKGLYACIVKKVLGNKSNFNNVINKLVAEYKEVE